MADYPDNIWIRDPAIDGKLIKGGGLNREIAKLVQARAEMTAIETALGTDPAGSAATLAARLGIRLSPSGLPRGRVYAIGEGDARGWFQHPGMNVQVSEDGPFTTAERTLTFLQAYTVPPTNIIVKYVTKSGGLRAGDSQLLYDSITTTTFKVYSREWSGADTWIDAVDTYFVAYIALGGS